MIDQSTVDKSMELFRLKLEFLMDYKLLVGGIIINSATIPRTDGKKKKKINVNARSSRFRTGI